MIHPLISVDELARRLSEVRVCDLRWDLVDRAKGRGDYLTGHIPGAVFVDLDRDLAGPPGERGRHPLPGPEAFAATLGSLGIARDTSVVVYDDMAGRVAARLWWMLRSIGHEASQVLDGGFQAWVDAGLAVETGAVDPEPVHYEGPITFTGVVTYDDLNGRALVDARSPQRFRGDHEPVDPRPGHIPGAVNIPSDENLDEDGSFHDPGRLAEVYAGLPENPVVSCGSGVTACHDALAMVVAGREMPDVYVGSYSEWSRSDRPVATGP